MMINNKLYIEDIKRVIDSNIPWNLINNSNMLITGANGLIASFLIDCLVYYNKIKNFNITIFALCRNREKAEQRFRDYMDYKNFNLIIQDVCIPLNSEINFDYIIHSASNSHPLAFSLKPVDTMKANIIGTINLLEYARKSKVKRFIFISSGEVYGQNNSSFKNALKEDDYGYIDCLEIRSAYPESKRTAETICISYKEQYNINVAILRLCHTYGPTMTNENTRADAQFIKKGLQKEDIILKSTGNQLRSYCYLSDTISALFYIMLLGENGKAYNVANKHSVLTIKEFAEIISSIVDVNVSFEEPNNFEKKGYSKIDNAVLNAEKLENLGWEAKVNIKDGLNRILKMLEK